MLNNNTDLATTNPAANIKDLLLTFWGYKKLIIGIFLCIFVPGMLLLLNLSNTYKATASILVEENSGQLSNVKDLVGAPEFDDLTLQTQKELLSSRELALKVIKKLSLDQNSEFRPDDLPENVNADNLFTDLYMKNLDIVGGIRSRILEVSFTSKDPLLAALITNEHAKAYLETQIESRKTQAQKLESWIQSEIAALKHETTKKSQMVQHLRKQSELVKGRNSEELIYQQISDLALQLPPIEAKKFAVQSRLEAIRKGDSDSAISEVVDSYLIQELKAKANDAAQTYEALRVKLGDSHPDLIAAQMSLAQANTAVHREIKNIEVSLENELKAMEAQERKLNIKLKTLSDKADVLQDKMIELSELEKEEQASRKLLENLLERNKEIQSRINFSHSDARIISEASVPQKASGPKKLLLAIMLIAVSGMISMIAVFILEYMNTGLRNFDDIRETVHLEPLGILPYSTKIREAIHNKKKSTYREAIKKIYMKGIAPHKGKTILVTSASPKEGRSTFVICMASYLAALDHKVLIINTDFLKSAQILKKNKNLASLPGLTDVLKNNAPYKDVILHQEENQYFLPAGDLELYSPDLLLSDNFSKLIEKLEKDYEYVLIDSPPALAQGDIEAIATKAGGVIMVVDWLRTKPQDLQTAVNILERASANIIGVVLNKVKIDKYKKLNHSSDFLLPRG